MGPPLANRNAVTTGVKAAETLARRREVARLLREARRVIREADGA
jgi:hypothetical protein